MGDFPDTKSRLNWDPIAFQKFIGNSYKEFEIPVEYKDIQHSELCNRESQSITLQPHQEFLHYYVSNQARELFARPGQPFQGILIFHGVGSGKTCSSIAIAEGLKAKDVHGNLIDKGYRTTSRIIIAVPKQLVSQYSNEIKGKCAAQITVNGKKQEYVSANEKATMDYFEKLELMLFEQLKQLDASDFNDDDSLVKKRQDRARLQNRITELRNNRKSKVEEIDSKVKQVYDIMSHDAFINKLFNDDPLTGISTLGPIAKQLQQPYQVLIIDEIQNLVSEPIPIETADAGGKKYRALLSVLQFCAHPTTRVILLSGTPIFDKPYEIGLTLNLLNPRLYFPFSKEEFNNLFVIDRKVSPNGKPMMKNKDLFKYMTSGYISYMKGANPNGYARAKIQTVAAPMTGLQLEVYYEALIKEAEASGMGSEDERKSPPKDIQDLMIEKPTEDEESAVSIFTNSRKFSNIVYPDPTIPMLQRQKNLLALLKQTLIEYGASPDAGYIPKKAMDEFLSVLGNYSKKFVELVKFIINTNESVSEIARPETGLIFVFSQYAEFYGAEMIGMILKLVGFTDFKDKHAAQETYDYRRFAIWSGSTKNDLRDQIQYTFNEKSNIDGKKIKVIIGTLAIREGISLYNVSSVHIMDPWWNEARIRQIIGRGIRWCGHDDPKAVVNIYKYVSTIGIVRMDESLKSKALGELSIEQHMYRNAEVKAELVEQFEKCMKQSAIDCMILRNGNIMRDFKRGLGSLEESDEIISEDIKCDASEMQPGDMNLKKILSGLTPNERNFLISNDFRNKQLRQIGIDPDISTEDILKCMATQAETDTQMKLRYYKFIADTNNYRLQKIRKYMLRKMEEKGILPPLLTKMPERMTYEDWMESQEKRREIIAMVMGMSMTELFDKGREMRGEKQKFSTNKLEEAIDERVKEIDKSIKSGKELPGKPVEGSEKEYTDIIVSKDPELNVASQEYAMYTRGIQKGPRRNITELNSYIFDNFLDKRDFDSALEYLKEQLERTENTNERRRIDVLIDKIMDMRTDYLIGKPEGPDRQIYEYQARMLFKRASETEEGGKKKKILEKLNEVIGHLAKLNALEEVSRGNSDFKKYIESQMSSKK